jgi:hypothetical protein
MTESRKYSQERLLEALKTSRSIRQALIKVGLAPQGGNYYTAHKLIKEHGLDTSHMTGQGWNKGDILGLAERNKRPLEEILVKDSDYSNTSRIKNRLIAAGMKARACQLCGLTEWNGKQIPLELDHINGDRFDNRLENLQILCPNCHAQGDNYRGRNIPHNRYK